MNTQTALITGASGGIGRALAHAFAARHHPLVLVARRADELHALAETLRAAHGVRAEVVATDLTQPHAVDQLCTRLDELGVAVTYLVNNAGLGDFGPFDQSDWARQAAMIDLNVRALTHLTHRLLPPMVARGHGRVLQLASTAAFQPGPLMSVYFATKAYVLSFAEATAEELRGTGVTVTALCPGPTASGFQEVSGQEASALVKNKRLPTAGQVADYGYRALMRGRRVAIYGTGNALLATAVRFVPRRVVTALVRRLSAPAT